MASVAQHIAIGPPNPLAGCSRHQQGIRVRTDWHRVARSFVHCFQLESRDGMGRVCVLVSLVHSALLPVRGGFGE